MTDEPMLIRALEEAKYELAAIVEDPDDPDFLPVVMNANPADAECLLKAWTAIVTALKAVGHDS